MKAKSFLFILVSLTATVSNAAPDAFDWLKSVEVPKSVYTEMHRYFVEQKETSNQANSYIANFVPHFHNQMVAETERFFQQQLGSKGCKPSVQVTFPKQLTNGYAIDSKVDFESGFMKVESYACLGNLDINKVFNTLMSKQFQVRVIDGVKSINEEGNRVCVKTSTAFLSTHYCVTKQVLNNGTQYIVQSFNDENRENPKDKIYFKDTINVITKLSNGEITFYNLMYARSKDIPGLFKGNVRGSAVKTYEKVRMNLIQLSK